MQNDNPVEDHLKQLGALTFRRTFHKLIYDIEDIPSIALNKEDLTRSVIRTESDDRVRGKK